MLIITLVVIAIAIIVAMLGCIGIIAFRAAMSEFRREETLHRDGGKF